LQGLFELFGTEWLGIARSLPYHWGLFHIFVFSGNKVKIIIYIFMGLMGLTLLKFHFKTDE
jgi:hypothetical protein